MTTPTTRRAAELLAAYELRFEVRQQQQQEIRNELDALLLYRKQKNITASQYKRKRDALMAQDKALLDAHIADQRSREIGAILEREERVRTQRIKKQSDKSKFLRTLSRNFASGRPFEVQFGNDFITDAEIFTAINRQAGRFLITAGENVYTLNDRTRVRLRDLIENQLITTDASNKSDEELFVSVRDTGSITIQPHLDTNQYAITDAEFFKYLHTTHYDFSRYGIFTRIDPTDYTDNCLMWALKQSGIEEGKLEHLKLMISSRSVPKKDLLPIADHLDVCIELHTRVGDKHSKTFSFGLKTRPLIRIGLLDHHYFLIEPTNVTRYALEHYEEVKNEVDSNLIFAKRGSSFRRDASRCMDSFEMVRVLLEQKDSLLKELTMSDQLIATTQFYDSVGTTISSLEYDPEKCIRSVEQSKENPMTYTNVFFDFETYCENGVHIPYLCVMYDGRTKRTFYGENCGLQLLLSLTVNTRLIAHNANYDYRFLLSYLTQIKELSRGTRLISCQATFNKLKIEIKDSYHLITMALRKFPQTFGLQGIQKEAMFYDLYSREALKQRWFSIDWVAETYVKEEERTQFRENVTKWNLGNSEGDFDIIEYSRRYCEMDCEILEQGYTTFRGWIRDLVGLNIDTILTAAGIAHRYFVEKGCYDGVNQLSGVPQMFIQGSVVGGRTMCSENSKHFTEGRINDFDAVSLYPSAMNRMDGFLMGCPKVLTNLTYDFLKAQDGYFVDIRITGVSVGRKFPLLSKKGKQGVRLFTNEMTGEIVRVDRTTLEDLIRFQGITFEVLRGYYFDEGFNPRIKEVIKFLFEERVRLKKQGNPAQEVYKLIMNSGYGKSIMKPVKTETKFFDKEDEFQVFLSRHYNWVEQYIRMGKKIKVTLTKTLDEHFNIAHVGTMILSMSKRIMNEVMCLAEDNGLVMFYQDTDSIHIKDKDITLLSQVFKETYGRELIGNGFGQFHSDFDLKGATDVVSRRAIFLGKKCYIDELVGQKDGTEVVGYHIRMKGIPNSCLLYTSKKLGYKTPFDMYEDLYKGIPITFDLTNDHTKPNFKFEKDGTVRTMDIFKRTIKFEG